jgi:hypothetical protein
MSDKYLIRQWTYLEIYAASRLIEDHYSAPPEQGTRQTDELPLAL